MKRNLSALAGFVFCGAFLGQATLAFAQNPLIKPTPAPTVKPGNSAQPLKAIVSTKAPSPANNIQQTKANQPAKIIRVTKPTPEAIKAAQHLRNLILDASDAYEKDDALALRVLVKRLGIQKLNQAQWERFRRYIVRTPLIGFDLLYKWDRVAPSDANVNSLEAKVNRALANAENHMEKKDYESAFKFYQIIARVIKADILAGHKDNLSLYNIVLQQMGRALFAAGRFAESAKVYNWISPVHPRFREVLFERAWAAFRAEKFDLANGTVASMYSSYYGIFIEPEAFLLQLYMYKRLCREEDSEKLMKNVDFMVKTLAADTNNNLLEDWAKSDNETSVLIKLALKEPMHLHYRTVNDGALIQEQQKILAALTERYVKEKHRYTEQLRRVQGYSLLAVSSQAQVKGTESAHDRDYWLKRGAEFWPVSDTEEWVDEIGRHIFIGASRCHH